MQFSGFRIHNTPWRDRYIAQNQFITALLDGRILIRISKRKVLKQIGPAAYMEEVCVQVWLLHPG